MRAVARIHDREISQNFHEDCAIVALLKTYAKDKDLLRGSILHEDILGRGLLEGNIFIGSSLVNLYAKCGALVKAKDVFDNLQLRDVVTWTALISGYAQHGHSEEALSCFDGMRRQGLSPTAATFACILKVCSSIEAIKTGEELHIEIVQKGLEENSILCTALVDMYAKCGAIFDAQQVFEKLSNRDLVCWTAMIAGYTQEGHGEKALKGLEEMKNEGVPPNAMTFACVLQACGSIGAVGSGEEVHAEIIKQGLLDDDSMLGSILVDSYAKCGAIKKAQQVFAELSARNVVAWTALITGFSQYAHGEEALKSYEKMKEEGVSPNEMTYASLLKACGSIGAPDKGKMLHGEIVREGLLENDTVLANALVDMYAKCGELSKAQEAFDGLAVRSIASWNALISGYCQHGHGEEAFCCYVQMQDEHLSPDSVTFFFILQACGSIGALDMGKQLHAEILKGGLVGESGAVGNALMDMYAKAGCLAKGQQVFHELAVQDRVSWNVLIAGYCQQGHTEAALKCFKQMQDEGISPDSVSLLRILQVCGNIGAIDEGEEVHVEVIREGLLEKDGMIGTALVDMYGKFGTLAKAREVFNELPYQDGVSWTALIAGYCQHGHGKEALDCFQSMQSQGIPSDAVTLACLLKACGRLGALEKGQEIHTEVVKEGFVVRDIVICGALVDMYAKCGELGKALEVFEKIPSQDSVVWTSLIRGYAEGGHHDLVLISFSEMMGQAVEPTPITFIVVLNACNYFGLVFEGQRYFDIMITQYGIIPTLEHYTCMVNLFGHAGKFCKALAMMTRMPLLDYLPAWFALLGACRRWGDMKTAKLAYAQAMRLDEKAALAYVRMSDIYVAARMQEGIGSP